MRKILWAIALIIAALAAYRLADKILFSKKVQAEKAAPVIARYPKISNIEQKLSLTGDVKADAEVSVRPRVEGRVEEINVSEGDFVKKGDVLLAYVSGIDPNDELFEDMVVRSPISGIVGMQLIKKGEQVTNRDGVVDPVFLIYKIDHVKVYAQIPAKYYSSVSKGMAADVSFGALPGQVFQGYITNARPVIDSLSRTMQIEIRIANRGNNIRPGMFAKLNIILERKSDALLVPLDSVFGASKKYVYVVSNGRAKKKKVATGITQDDYIEIESGLLKSDKIITKGRMAVKEGTKVREIKKDQERGK